jgi:hypothetical protein
VQIAGSLLLGYASRQGLISAETMMRGVMVLIGLGLAAYGDRIPKSTYGPPPPTVPLAALRQSVLRTAGWSMMLGGVAFAGFWAFAPLEIARVGAMAALGGFMAVMCGFVTWWIYAYHRSPNR